MKFNYDSRGRRRIIFDSRALEIKINTCKEAEIRAPRRGSSVGDVSPALLPFFTRVEPNEFFIYFFSRLFPLATFEERERERAGEGVVGKKGKKKKFN